jgi:hypothetical protein
MLTLTQIGPSTDLMLTLIRPCVQEITSRFYAKSSRCSKLTKLLSHGMRVS